MSQQTIDTSTATDTLAAGFTKVNDNFTEVYASIIQTGMMIDYFGTTAPSGWVLARGGTIGKAGSGASARQNADTENLFVLLWNSISNSYCPVSGGRGASAAADFAAEKTLTLPDLQGKVSVGKDVSIFSNLGSSVGSETVTLIEDNLPSHSHNIELPSSTNSVQIGGDGGFLTNLSTSSAATSSTGSATPVSVVQPSLVVNKIIKL
jgi:hypothetical protein